MPVIVVILVAYAFSGRPAILVGDLSTLLLLAGLTVGQLSDLARAADYRLAYVESRRRIALMTSPSTRFRSATGAGQSPFCRRRSRWCGLQWSTI
ncbi:MAG: hypothetical protein E5Y59_18110 [Mesorhizobium sp.]|nr:MAG: hypothetical protein E5Y59_18110 [Mesorhizobium sp.]